MPIPRNTKFKGQLTFDAGGYAINPFTQTNAWDAADFIDVVLTVVGTGTVLVYGTAQEIPPDFSSASTITNSKVGIVTADYSVQNTYYDGSTGVVVSSSTKLVELNTNLLSWVGIHRSVNTVQVLMTITDNS